MYWIFFIFGQAKIVEPSNEGASSEKAAEPADEAASNEKALNELFDE